MTRKTPVVAVVPHYNMPVSLVRLVKQLLAQDYAAVYILDDHSTNCDIEETLKPFGSKAMLIKGARNLGAGMNRNRILEAPKKQLSGSILHFVDADTVLLTKSIPEKARAFFVDKTVGEVGGLIKDTEGWQYEHNYNPKVSLAFIFFGMPMQTVIYQLAKRHRRTAKALYGMLGWALQDYPNVFQKPVRKKVFCLAEANIFIPYDIFVAVGGFEQKLRYNEGREFAYQLEQMGLDRYFDPSVVVEHLAIRVRGKKWLADGVMSILFFLHKYGVVIRHRTSPRN